MAYYYNGLYGPEAIISTAGVPQPSLSVTVYIHNTSTPAVLYNGQGPSAATVTNPTTTDAIGNLTFYAQPGLYDLSFTVGGTPTTVTVEVLPWWQNTPTVPINNFMGGLSVIPGAFGLQWGNGTLTTNASGVFTVTFPTPFPTACQSVVATPGDTNGTSPTAGASITLSEAALSATGFGGVYYIGNTPVSGTVRVNYIAVGY